MLEEEAIAIKDMLKHVKDKNILNIGSSDEQFYKKEQPYIWSELMYPLIQNNNKINNLDIKKSKGVDIISDINKYIPGKYDIILFCNCIEHITKPFIHVLDNLYNCLKHNGILVMSAPGQYPKHEDPFDNLMRFPSLDQWVSLFKFHDNKFRIIQYYQTEEIPAPARYGFKKLTYSTIVKCTKSKLYIPKNTPENMIRIDYFLMKLNELRIKEKNPKIKTFLNDLEFMLDLKGIMEVKKFLKGKVRGKNITPQSDRLLQYYNQLLGDLRHSGVIIKEEIQNE